MSLSGKMRVSIVATALDGDGPKQDLLLIWF